jgi:hypothetical protein
MDFTGLYERAIAHYLQFETEWWVVPQSIPILYFGDLKNYLGSRLKIVTVGLNPSDMEFKEDRFQIDNARTCTPIQLEQSLSRYFKVRPYTDWFDRAFESLLQPLGASYYGEHHPGKVPGWWSAQPNVALHTEIGTPIATDPTWSKLPRQATKRLQATGFPLWRDLIRAFDPNLILISVAKRHLRQLGELDWRALRPCDASGPAAEMRLAEFGNSKIVWGQAQVRPLFYLKSEHRRLAARAILQETLLG